MREQKGGEEGDMGRGYRRGDEEEGEEGRGDRREGRRARTEERR